MRSQACRLSPFYKALTSRPFSPTAKNFISLSANTFAFKSFTISSAPPNGAMTSTTHKRSPDFQSCGRRREVPAASRSSTSALTLAQKATPTGLSLS